MHRNLVRTITPGVSMGVKVVGEEKTLPLYSF